MTDPRASLPTAPPAEDVAAEEVVEIDMENSGISGMPIMTPMDGMPPRPPPPPEPELLDPVVMESVPVLQPIPVAPPQAPAPAGPPPPATPLAPPFPPLPQAPLAPLTPPPPELAVRWQEAAAVYEKEARALGADKRAAPLWFEVGRIFEEQLLQPRAAAASFQQAFKLDPTFSPVIHTARRFFQDLNSWAMVVNLLDSELAVERDARTRAALLVERGQVLEKQLAKPEDAAAAYRAAFDADASYTPAWDALGRTLRAKGAWPELAEAMQKSVAALPRGATRADRTLDLARLYEHTLKDADRAVATYQEVLAEEPHAQVALRALERLFAQTGRHEELLAVLQKLWDMAPDAEETASLPLAMARVARYALKDEARAAAYLEIARTTRPRDATFLRALTDIYATAGRHADHVAALRELAELATEEKHKVALLFEAGEVLEDKLGDPAGAVAQYRAVLSFNPRHVPSVQGLERLYAKTGQHEELARLYEREIAALDDVPAKMERLFSLAELRADTLQDLDGAVAAYRQALAVTPDYLPALKALASLLLAHNRVPEAILVYEEELALTREKELSVHLLDKLAQLWEERLSRLDKAAETFERILQVAPNHLPAIRSLGRIFGRSARWRDLVRINSMEADLTTDTQQMVALLHKNGEILEEKIGDPEAAMGAFRKALSLAPNHLPTLKSLGRLYAARGEWKDLIRMYAQEVEYTRQSEQRVVLLMRIAEVHELHLKDSSAAVEAYRSVLVEQPEHHPSVRALTRLYQQQGNWTGVLEMVQREAELLADPVEQAQALYTAGEILLGRLERPQEAAELYGRAIQKHPTFEAAHSALRELASATGALDAEQAALQLSLDAQSSPDRWLQVARDLGELLAERRGQNEAAARVVAQILERNPGDIQAQRSAVKLATRRGDWPRAIALAEQLAAVEPEAHAAAAWHLEVAAWKAGKLDPPGDPIPSYLKALEYEPNHPVAQLAVERACRRTQAWDVLYALFERQRTSRTDLPTVLDLSVRMADLAAHRLGKDELAVRALEFALKLDPGFVPALRRLEPLYEKLGRQADKLSLLTAQAEATRDPERALAMLLEAARLQEETLNNLDGAVDACNRILQRQPHHPAALERLVGLLTKAQRWDALVALLSAEADASREPERWLARILDTGRLLDEQFNNIDGAVDACHRVLQRQPHHLAALEQLSALFTKAQRWEPLLALLAAQADSSREPERWLARILDTGRLLDEQFNNIDGAVDACHRVLQRQPHHPAALEQMAGLLTRAQRWEPLMTFLAAQADASRDPERWLARILEASRQLEEKANDVDGAITACNRVLQRQPHHPAALERLTALLTQAQRWDALVDLLARRAAALPDNQEKLELTFRCAQVLMQQGRRDEAVAPLHAVLRLVPTHLAAQQMLGELHESAGRFVEAVNTYLALLTVLPDPAAVAANHVRLANLFAERLNDAPRAAQHLLAALSLRPEDITLASKLANFYLSQRAWPEAADMLTRMAERDPDPEARVGHLLYLAQVMEEGFQDVGRAVEAYQRILEVKPGHPGALSRLAKIYERAGDVNSYVQVLNHMIMATPATEKAQRAALHLQVAQIQVQNLNAPDKALLELRNCLEVDPDNAEARLLRALLLGRTPGSAQQAVAEHQRVLRLQPWRVESYRELWRLYETARQHDRKFLCCEVLALLRQADKAEQFFFEDNRPKVRHESEGALSTVDHEQMLVHPKERGPIRDLLRLVAPELAKAIPVDLSVHGVGRAEKLASKGQEPARKLCDGIFHNLGGESLDIYVSRANPQTLAMVNGDPPALVLGAEVLKRHPGGEVRFMLGERLEGLFSAHQLLEGLSAGNLEELLLGLCAAVDDAFPATTLTPEVQELTKRIQKALSRATRKSAADSVATLVQTKGRWDTAGYLKAARWTRLRAGMLMSNDLEHAMRVVGREFGAAVRLLEPQDVVQKLAREEYRELLGFFTSDEFATLRQRLRLAIDT